MENTLTGLSKFALLHSLNEEIYKRYPVIRLTPKMIIKSSSEDLHTNWDLDYSLLVGIQSEAIYNISRIVDSHRLNYFVMEVIA